jgi:hypothetical protein
MKELKMAIHTFETVNPLYTISSKRLQTINGHDILNGIESRKPEVVASGNQDHPSSVKLDDRESKRTPILADSPNLYKQSGEFVQNHGYFIIPRSLTSDQRYQAAHIKYQKVLHIILENVAFSETTHAIGNEIIKIEIGQFCISERALVELCNRGVKFQKDKVDKNIIHRAVHFWATCGIVNHQTNHGKMLLTITVNEFYAKNRKGIEPRNESIVNRNRTTNEERKERKESCIRETINDQEPSLSYAGKNEELEDSYIPSSQPLNSDEDSDMPKTSESQFIEDFEALNDFVKDEQIPMKSEDLERWIRKWGGQVVRSTIQLMQKQKEVRSVARWMETALKKDWARLANNIPINKKFAEDFKQKHKWEELTIVKKYCTIQGASYDLQFKMEPDLFQNLLQSKYEALHRRDPQEEKDQFAICNLALRFKENEDE